MWWIMWLCDIKDFKTVPLGTNKCVTIDLMIQMTRGGFTSILCDYSKRTVRLYDSLWYSARGSPVLPVLLINNLER